MTEKELSEEIIEEMTKIGIIWGHKKTKTHPLMKEFIIGNRNEIEILNPKAVWESLKRAQEFLKEIVKSGGKILFVAVQAAARNLIADWSKELNMPSVTNRWLGGTLTNFKVIEERLKYYLDLKLKKEKGELAKYTKKEQLLFDQEIKKLAEKFNGLTNLTKLPEVIFIVDPSQHQTAVREARRMKIPIVAIMDNDDNPSMIDYPIFANDHSRQSLQWLIDKIKESLKDS